MKVESAPKRGAQGSQRILATLQAAPAASMLVALLIALGGSPATAGGRVWNLGPDGSGDLPSIQDALDQASAADTIRLSAGIYFENLTWPATEALVLEGEGDPALCIIDGQHLDGVIAVHSGVDSTSVIRRLTLINGSPQGT